MSGYIGSVLRPLRTIEVALSLASQRDRDTSLPVKVPPCEAMVVRRACTLKEVRRAIRGDLGGPKPPVGEPVQPPIRASIRHDGRRMAPCRP
jgi:hypothetical protein